MPPVSRVRAVSSTHEPFEDDVADLCWDAGPVVGDLQPNRRRLLRQGDGDAVLGVLLGVVHEVANHAVQLFGITVDDRGRVGTEHVHVDVIAADPAGCLGGDLGEVDRLVWSLLMGVEPSEEQQIFGEVLEPFDVAERVPGDVVPGGPLGVGDGDLQVGTERRERSAQFVAGVGDEAALLLDRGVESGEGVVDGDRQLADLVARVGYRYSAMEVAGGDVGHRARDPSYRSQCPPDGPPGHRGNDDHEQRKPDREHA